MTITTVAVSIAVNQITGVALPLGRVHFELTAADVNGGIVAPLAANVVLDVNGAATAELWPNALGSQGTQYRVTIYDAGGGLQYSGLATVPNAACSLHDIIALPAPGTVTTLAAGFVTTTPPAGYTSTNQQALDAELAAAIAAIVAGSVTWGAISGTLANQTDLSAALAAKISVVAAAAGYQPLDSDLSAIAALATTAYGRAFLALVDAPAGRTALGLGTAATAATGDFDAAGAAAAAQAASQPLDSDLTAIAALTTTVFGRSVLALADAVALRTLAGLGTLATQSGTFSGTSSGTNTGDQDLSGLQVTSAKDASGGYAGLTLFKINFKNALNTFTSFFTNANTAARTYTFPDKDITVAGLVDITGTNSGTNTGDETGARVATLLHAAAAKTTLVDGDEVNGTDSANGFSLIRVTLANVKAFLKTYFDAIYAPLGGSSFISATGGTITTDGDYKVHSFTATGNSTFTIVSGEGLVERLIAGGGGGGGSGGGGAGGVRTIKSVLAAGAYAVRVGLGGPAASNGGTSTGGTGLNGAYSAFQDDVALGGRGGGPIDAEVAFQPCGSGAGCGAASAPHAAPIGTPGQGNNGGATTVTTSPNPAAGGGGASTAGSAGSGSTGGVGGDGVASSITGASVTYGGGGGGGVFGTGAGGAGGAGGGGAGHDTNGNATAGSASTGGGGGGAGSTSAPGAGGTGVVIVRYKFQ